MASNPTIATRNGFGYIRKGINSRAMHAPPSSFQEGASGAKRLMIAFLLMLSAAAFFVPRANADTLQYVGPAYGGYINTWGLSNEDPAAISSSPMAGGFMMSNLTNPAGSFAAWCVDIFTYLDVSPAGSSYNTVDSGSLFGNSGTVNALERLASQRLDSLMLGNDVVNSGAFQLATWEIVNEKSGIFDLGSGSFMVQGATGNAIATANSWLSTLDSGVITKSLVVSSWQSANGGSQDIATFTSPVPEPEIYAMMLAGLGLMGFVARRRKQNVSLG